MGERLPCKQEVTSSNLVFSTLSPDSVESGFLHGTIGYRSSNNRKKKDIRSGCLFYIVQLFCAEDSVSCVAQSRTDICICIQFPVDMTYIELYVRMCVL